MKEELGTVTTIVIAHRLTTIKKADTIIVMAKGKIVEIGNHDSILQDYPHGTYAKLVNDQETLNTDEAQDEEAKGKESELRQPQTLETEMGPAPSSRGLLPGSDAPADLQLGPTAKSTAPDADTSQIDHIQDEKVKQMTEECN